MRSSMASIAGRTGIDARRRMPLTMACSHSRQTATSVSITQKQLSGRPVDVSR